MGVDLAKGTSEIPTGNRSGLSLGYPLRLPVPAPAVPALGSHPRSSTIRTYVVRWTHIDTAVYERFNGMRQMNTLLGRCLPTRATSAAFQPCAVDLDRQVHDNPQRSGAKAQHHTVCYRRWALRCGVVALRQPNRITAKRVLRARCRGGDLQTSPQ